MEKKMKVISWIATGLSMIGLGLNIFQIIWCWVIWSLGNIFWIYWSINKKEWSQLSLWLVYTVMNFYGWYQWAILK